MPFIKQNLFLVILVAVVMVLGGFMVFMSRGIAKDVDGQVVQRNQLVQQVSKIRKNPINQRMVEAHRKAVEQIQASAAGIKQECVDWNLRYFKPLELEINGQSVPAFPFDNVHEQVATETFSLQFTGRYKQALTDMLAKLNSTTAPTQADVQAHTMQWENQLAAESAGQDRPATSDTSDTYGPGAVGSAGAATSVPQDARQRGRESAIMSRALAGEVYADLVNLDPAYPYAVHNQKPENLWFAQVNLWVTQDILEAIRQTNEESYQQRGIQNGRNVSNSAVKRLVSLSIDDNYVAAPAAPTATPTRSRTPAMPPAGAMPGAPGMSMMDMALMYEGEEDDVTEFEEGPQNISNAIKAMETADGLTQRGCTQDYDVVYYNFSVVMPSRYLLVLQKNLLERNYHTIRMVTVNQVEVDKASSGTARGQSGPSAGHGDYYYGPDDVVEVKFEGELLLLADWVRGTYDEAGGTWTRPPLMPVTALTAAFGTDSTALRSGDKARMPAADPAAATPPGAPRR